jgi:aminoglycoside 6-adenylyltransferase
MSYEQLEAKFIAWAKQEPHIRAAIVHGSQARTHKTADEWSNLDIVMFTTTPDAYYASNDWLDNMGEVWLATENTALVSSPEWLVIYAGGLRVDYLIEPATDALSQVLQRPSYRLTLRRGYRILFDKDQEGEYPQPWLPETYCKNPPEMEEFVSVVSRLLFCSERTARVLCRGEIWWAKRLCDMKMKEYLLRLMEWHACAIHGEDHDTWRNGRFLHEWIAPEISEALPATFASYDIDDIWRANLATVELGCHLARETAELWQYDYPYKAEQHILGWIRSLR